MVGKLTGKFLIAGTKTSTRNFDNLNSDALTNNQGKAFLNKYKVLLETGSTVVSGKITKYETTEVNFD